MARKWSLEEDYIVCAATFEFEDLYCTESSLDELMEKLAEAGFADRSRGAVQKRARDYAYIYRGWIPLGLTNQVAGVYRACYNKKCTPTYQAIQSFVRESVEFERDFEESTGAVDFPEWFSTEKCKRLGLMALEPEELSFKETLFYYIEKSGMTDVQVYKAARVSKDKFNHIVNGRKGKSIKARNGAAKVNASPRTVMQLCLGLNLNYDDAVILMASAGYAFQRSELTDRVVVAFLKLGNYTIYDVNLDLYERGLPVFSESLKDN